MGLLWEETLNDIRERLEWNRADAVQFTPILERALGEHGLYLARDTLIGAAISDIDATSYKWPRGKGQRAFTGSGSAFTALGREWETERRHALLIPAEVIGEDRKMQEAMPAQDGLDQKVDAIADDGQRDSSFSASPIKSDNPLIDRESSRKAGKDVLIGPEQFDLAREAFLACNLPSHPSLFPFAPRGQGKRFENRVRRIDASNGAVEITKDFGLRDTGAKPSTVFSVEGLIQQIATRVKGASCAMCSN